MEVGKGRICVTGATGFIASWTVKCLLQHGYSVNATTRTAPGGARDVSYLTNLPGAAERLQIFYADLDDPETFVPAIEGCIGVFHIAHPLEIKAGESEIQQLTAGVTGILKACADTKTVKRVVLTSSIATFALASHKVVVDENCWSTLEFMRNVQPLLGPYAITKTITEKHALEVATELGLDLVSVGPTFVTGPFLGPNLPLTVHISLALIYGTVEEYAYLKDASLVHVDDVARAHIHLFEYPEAKGQRYLCTGVDYTIEDIHELISRKYPHFKLPNSDSWKDVISVKTSGTSQKKILETGFKFKYGLEEMIEAAIECAKEKGFLPS